MNIVNEQFEDLKYAINYPNCYKEGENFPVIIYLHGAGTRGDDMNVLINNACFQETDEDGFKALSYVYSDMENDDLYSFLYKNSAYA